MHGASGACNTIAVYTIDVIHSGGIGTKPLHCNGLRLFWTFSLQPIDTQLTPGRLKTIEGSPPCVRVRAEALQHLTALESR